MYAKEIRESVGTSRQAMGKSQMIRLDEATVTKAAVESVDERLAVMPFVILSALLRMEEMLYWGYTMTYGPACTISW